MRVAVIGGRGHFGRSVVAGLREHADIEVVVAGRSVHNDIRVDLADSASLHALDEHDAVVNCADSLAAPPDMLVRRCLHGGPPLVETVGEPVAIRRILHSVACDDTPPRSPVLLGAGIFPGMSNLVAAEAIAAVEDCSGVEVAMRWNPMSAGGAGMVGLVPHLLVVPTHRIVDGAVVEGPSMGPGPDLPFPDGVHGSLHLPFTEPTLLAHTHPHLRSIAAYGSVDPDVMMSMFRWFPKWLLCCRPMRALLWLQFTVIRRLVRRGTPAHVRIVARARNDAGKEEIRTFEAEDGIATAGRIVAAMLLELRHAPPGLHVPGGSILGGGIRDKWASAAMASP